MCEILILARSLESHIARKSVWRHASEWATDEIVDAELLSEAINNF